MADAITGYNPHLILYAPSGSRLSSVATAEGLTVWQEFFADRSYEWDGSLTPRNMEGSVINDVDVVVERVLDVVSKGQIKSRTGEMISLHFDTICIHGDHPGAATVAKRLREVFKRSRIMK